jgi:hypothetical protein
VIPLRLKVFHTLLVLGRERRTARHEAGVAGHGVAAFCKTFTCRFIPEATPEPGLFLNW